MDGDAGEGTSADAEAGQRSPHARRTGTGRTTDTLETSEWSRPPSGWDVAALGMRVQADKAKRQQEKQARKRASRAEGEPEGIAGRERWRLKYQED